MMKLLWLISALFLSICHASEIKANVTAVSTSGISGAYTFAVTLKSDETGCAQYADWWEILNDKGDLLYRRILVHSHPDTQPFTRSGGKVSIKSDEIVYVRAHMNKLGYVGDVFEGTVQKGFKKAKNVPIFPKELETQKPLPSGCTF